VSRSDALFAEKRSVLLSLKYLTLFFNNNNRYDFTERAVEGYISECERTVYNQIDQVELLETNFELIPEADLGNFYDVTMGGYTQKLDEAFDVVCVVPIWDDATDNWSGAGEEVS